jgi:hypothetical protein
MGAFPRNALDVEVSENLQSPRLAAVVYFVPDLPCAFLCINPSHVGACHRAQVVAWARCVAAEGVLVAWLLANEISDLA